MMKQSIEAGHIEELGEMERTDFLLLVLSVFRDAGRDEVSLPEINECVSEFQDHVQVGYSFSERFLYSADLMSELRRLKFEGKILYFNYKHNGFLPKTFFKLTTLGNSYLRKSSKSVGENTLHLLKQIARSVMLRNTERFKLWGR